MTPVVSALFDGHFVRLSCVGLALAVSLVLGVPQAEGGEGAKQPPTSVPGLTGKPPAGVRSVKTDRGYMIPYEMKIPGTDVTFEMLPIPGGTFRMGSPQSEAGRKENEGPQFDVRVEPFWMGKYEVTWAEYKQFMGVYDVFKEFSSLRTTLSPKQTEAAARRRRAKLKAALEDYPALKERLLEPREKADAITAPTKLYEPTHTFEYGEDPQLPAVTMTQYAAKHYTKWLTGLTGYFHRLPSEAEWEYACRAGTTTAYSFGDNPAKLKDYAWYFENNQETIHKVGLKKPNPWGLYDIHGNAAEWVLDELKEDAYDRFEGRTVSWRDTVVWPTIEFPRVVRGGHWDSDAEELRSAARMGSHDENWKSYDPNIPLSPWWFTSDPARGVGFRIVRPLYEPDEKEKQKAWEAGAEDILDAVADRLQEGRGVADTVDGKLPDAIRELRELKKKLDQ